MAKHRSSSYSRPTRLAQRSAPYPAHPGHPPSHAPVLSPSPVLLLPSPPPPLPPATPHTLRTSPLIHRQRPINRRQKRRTHPTRTPLRHRNERVVPHPIRCIVRGLPGQRSITHAPNAYHIYPSTALDAPGSNTALSAHTPASRDRRYRPALRPDRLTRRAKVQQHWRIIRIARDDVARLDVPMQKIRPMDHG